METITSQQLYFLLALTMLVHCAMGLFLFMLARANDRNTSLWATVGVVGGLLGLIAYLIVSIKDYSQPQPSPYPAFRGDDEELAAHLLNQTDMHGETDRALEELIRDGYLEKAREMAREKMQASFNYGDAMRERIYRGYLDRIIKLLERTPTSMHR